MHSLERIAELRDLVPFWSYTSVTFYIHEEMSYIFNRDLYNTFRVSLKLNEINIA